MLKFLSVDNFALMDHLEVEFAEGLNLITGETGSGKSILVDAVALLVGARASQEMVREGFDRARVEGIFQIPARHPVRELLQEAGLEGDEEGLIVRREISLSGANKVYVNGTLTTRSQLARLGELLADIHGQHEQQLLLRPEVQLGYLDAFAGNARQLERVAAACRELEAACHEREAAQGSEQERLQRLDALEFQIEDIEKLGLTPGLDRELEQERALLGTAERRLELSRQAYRRLYEDERSALSWLGQSQKDLQELAAIDPALEEQSAELESLRFRLEELCYRLRDYAGAVEFNPARLEAVEDRLAEIQKARRKYGQSADSILAYLETIREEAGVLSRHEVLVEELARREEQCRSRYREAALKLSRARASDALRLKEKIEAELAELSMEHTVFEVALDPDPERVAETGIDQAEFLFSANPGETPRPLARIASGGELSRTVLALKSIATLEEQRRTLVFDEVDAGIGGGVASSLGARLAALARDHQVFCVTHLPQIASFAARHFRVDKKTSGNRTLVHIRLLEQERERVEELSRMMAGSRVSETTRKQARELLQQGTD